MPVQHCCDPWRMKTFHIFRRPSLAHPLRVTAMGTSGQCQALYWETRTDWLQVVMTSKSWAIAVTSTWDFVALCERATKAILYKQRKTSRRDQRTFLATWQRLPPRTNMAIWRSFIKLLLALFVSLPTLFTYCRVLVISRQNHPVNLVGVIRMVDMQQSMTNLINTCPTTCIALFVNKNKFSTFSCVSLSFRSCLIAAGALGTLGPYINDYERLILQIKSYSE
jgi:hypothetical protein